MHTAHVRIFATLLLRRENINSISVTHPNFPRNIQDTVGAQLSSISEAYVIVKNITIAEWL